MVYTADEAAKQLESEGLSVEILDLRTLIPWDKDAVLESAGKTSKVLVLHEDTRTGGFGAEIAATIAEEGFENLDAPVKRITAPDCPVPFSPTAREGVHPAGRGRRRRLARPRGVLGMATDTAIEVVMPQMGVSVSEGTITKWLKNEGEEIAADESLLEISTDKVDTEVPSPGSGVLLQILVPEGETVDVGTKLAVIGPAGSAPPAPADEEPKEEAPAAPLPSLNRLRLRRRPLPRNRPPLRQQTGRRRQDVRLACRGAHRIGARSGRERRSRHRPRRPRDQEGHPRLHRAGRARRSGRPPKPPRPRAAAPEAPAPAPPLRPPRRSRPSRARRSSR